MKQGAEGRCCCLTRRSGARGHASALPDMAWSLCRRKLERIEFLLFKVV